ncbi:MAG TPA: hypothetical protein VGM99_07875 [Candidatus Cybelea sp.]
MLKLLEKARCAACLCAFAVALSACATNQMQAAPTAPAQQAAHRAARSSGDLLYVGAQREGAIYSYPDGSPIGTFSTSATIHGMCSDAKGDVFIVAGKNGAEPSAAGYVYEFAHGGTSPVATLNLPTHEIPVSCSSDRGSGDLAVTSYNSRDFAPKIEVYAGAHGTPATFASGALGANPQAGYDASGDLFVTSGGNLGVELVKGSQQLATITFDQTLGGVDHVQWDGAHFALQSFQDSEHNKERLFEHVYRLKISGDQATIMGLSQFKHWHAGEPGQSWIDGDTLVATPGSTIALWKYPAGGQAYLVLHPSHVSKAVTISRAP